MRDFLDEVSKYAIGAAVLAVPIFIWFDQIKAGLLALLSR